MSCVILGIIEPLFVEKHPCQVPMNPKQLIVSVPVELGGNVQGCLVMGNGLLPLAATPIYVAKETVTYADPIFFALVEDEIDRTGSRFFCGCGQTGLEQHK